MYSFSLAKTFPGTEYKLQVPDTSGAGPENLPNSLKKENAGNRLSKKEDLIFEKACVELEGDSISSDETSSESDEDQNNADASLKCQAGYGFGNSKLKSAQNPNWPDGFIVCAIYSRIFMMLLLPYRAVTPL